MSPTAALLVGFWIGVGFSTIAVVVLRNARRAEAWGDRLADYADEPLVVYKRDPGYTVTTDGPDVTIDFPELFNQDFYDQELESARRIAPGVFVKRAKS